MKSLAQEPKPVLITKISIFGSLILLAIIGVSVAPKAIYGSNTSYSIGAGLAIQDDDNLSFLDYKVYVSDAKFQAGLINDVAARQKQFIERREIMAVKIHGSASSKLVDDYLLISSMDTPELNIEYYIVKNVLVYNTTIPCRTLIMLLDDTFNLINGVYLGVLIGLGVLVVTLSATPLVRNTVELVKRHKEKEIPAKKES